MINRLTAFLGRLGIDRLGPKIQQPWATLQTIDHGCLFGQSFKIGLVVRVRRKSDLVGRVL